MLAETAAFIPTGNTVSVTADKKANFEGEYTKTGLIAQTPPTIEGVATLVFSNGTNNSNFPGTKTSSSDWKHLRIYVNNTMTIKPASGIMITGVTINYISGNVKTFTANVGTYAFSGTVGTWTPATGTAGTEQDLVLTSSGTSRINNIIVTYEKSSSDKKAADLKFTPDVVNFILGDAFTKPTLTKATTAAVTYSSDAPTVAAVDATTGDVEIKGAGKAVITAAAASNDEFYAGSASYTINVTAPLKTMERASQVVDGGKYVFYFEGHGASTLINTTNNYGYMMCEEVTIADGKFQTEETNLITINKVEGKGYTMTDTKGRFLGMDASHATSFNLYATADASGSNCYWDITFDGPNAKFANTGREGYFIGGKVYGSDGYEAVTTNLTSDPLPQLWQVEGTAEVAKDPIITTDINSLYFASIKGGEAIVKTVKVTTENYTGNIAVESDNTSITVAKSSYTLAEAAEGIEITFNGTETSGDYTAVITFSAGSLTAEVECVGFTSSATGAQDDPFTVSDVVGLKSTYKGPYYVTGKISAKCAANAKDGVLQTTETVAASNIVLEGENNDIIAVQLPSNSEVRKTLNIVDNEDNVGKTIVIKGSLEDYFEAPGVKNPQYVSGLQGIEDVEFDENAPAVYYNLQGVRVENPTEGLYIRVQNGRSTKELVK